MESYGGAVFCSECGEEAGVTYFRKEKVYVFKCGSCAARTETSFIEGIQSCIAWQRTSILLLRLFFECVEVHKGVQRI